MRKKHIFIIIGIILLFISLAIIKKHKGSEPRPTIPPQLSAESPLVNQIKVLAADGGRVDWSSDGNLIAFDREGKDGYYDVWTMRPDGREQKCLTCDNPNLPQKHLGNPDWHPSGQYLLFQAQDPNLKIFPFKFKLAAKMVASPGGAINNNLWMMTSDGNQFWQLTQIQDGMAVLHPHFSHDGSKIIWAEKVQLNPKGSQQSDTWGEWVIKIAAFEMQNTPILKNIQEFKPDDLQFYETHGFFPNDEKIIFSGFPRGVSAGNLDLYTYDLISRGLENLTNTPTEWDEHAQISPEGTEIIWMSSVNIEQDRDRMGNIKMENFKMDFWIMDIDGSNKQRLTYFNDSAAPEYISSGVVCADNSWSPDGKKLVAKIRIASKDPLKDEMIILIDLGVPSANILD